MAGDPVYEEQAVNLVDPTVEAVRDAFAALPQRGGLTCVCRWGRRLEILAALEACGAFAIRFRPAGGFASLRIASLKGKSGPCYDTGRRAAYRGCAAAVLDDDRHLIVGEIRVCEKTGGIYSLEPYRSAIAVTEADPELLARLDCDPVRFDCSTFDTDSRRLAEMVENVQCTTDNAQRPTGVVPVIYPGPFRAMVLSAGSVVRRGVAALVPEGQVGGNGLLRLPPELAGEARPCETFAAAYRARGAAFILEPLTAGGGPGEPVRPMGEARLDGRAIAALRAAPGDLKRRLSRLVEAREPYLVLTGSDPDAACGCCPSPLVGAANRLVAAGALQSYTTPGPAAACAATFYAFTGELCVGEAGAHPQFRLCEAVRMAAAEALEA